MATNNLKKYDSVYIIALFSNLMMVNHWGVFFEKVNADKELYRLQQKYPDNDFRILQQPVNDFYTL